MYYFLVDPSNSSVGVSANVGASIAVYNGNSLISPHTSPITCESITSFPSPFTLMISSCTADVTPPPPEGGGGGTTPETVVEGFEISYGIFENTIGWSTTDFSLISIAADSSYDNPLDWTTFCNNLKYDKESGLIYTFVQVGSTCGTGVIAPVILDPPVITPEEGETDTAYVYFDSSFLIDFYIFKGWENSITLDGSHYSISHTHVSKGCTIINTPNFIVTDTIPDSKYGKIRYSTSLGLDFLGCNTFTLYRNVSGRMVSVGSLCVHRIKNRNVFKTFATSTSV